MRELGLVLAAAGAGVLIVAVVVLGPTIAAAHSRVDDSTRVVEVLQPADTQP